MKYIIKYIRPFLARMSFGVTVKFLGAVMDLLLPSILAIIIDDIVPTENMPRIFLWGAIMLLCSGLGLLFNIVANRMAAGVARDTSRNLRHDLFSNIMYLSSAQVDKFTVPSLETRLTSDTYNVHNLVGSMQRLGIRAPILLVGGIVITLTLDPMLTLVLLAVLPFITLTVFLISRKGIPLYTTLQKSTDKLVRVLRENIQGVRVIKALSKIDYESRRFEGVNGEVAASERRAATVMATTNPLMNVFLNAGLTGVILLGAFRVDAELSEPGKIIAFMTYFTLISQAMMTITRMFVMLSRGIASANRIGEILDTRPALEVMPPEENYTPAGGATRMDAAHINAPHIKFENVNFSYNKNKNNLEDISFEIPRGGTLGIIGATGSGKSTLIQLLMRFYDPDGGRVLIDGRDVRTIDNSELRGMFGIAMQNDFIRAGSVAENIDFGRGLNAEQIRAAAVIAQADGYIGDFADGYSHPLTAKGTNISGGQKQRLLVARAVAAQPEIIILDDSSSALDYKTDSEMRRAIREKLVAASEGVRSTLVVVAQRVSSIMQSDLILVLDEGRIIGMGRHDELMRSCTVYREISESQMGEIVN